MILNMVPQMFIFLSVFLLMVFLLMKIQEEPSGWYNNWLFVNKRYVLKLDLPIINGKSGFSVFRMLLF